MKKLKEKLTSVILGLTDGIFPTLGNSIIEKEDGEKTVDFTRLFAALFGFMMWIALIMGWISWSEFLGFIKMIFML